MSRAEDITEPSASRGDPAETQVARLADEVAALREEVQRLRGDGPPRSRGEARGGALDDAGAARRRLGRRRPNRSFESDEATAMVSRRRLFGLHGGAAVAGTGLAVLGSATDPAQATTGNLVFGQTNDAGTALTSLTSSSAETFSSHNTGNATGLSGDTDAGQGVLGQTGTGIGVRGTAGSSGTGISGDSENGYSGQFSAPSANLGGAHLYLAPGLFAGAPTTASHVAGELWMDTNAELWQCVTAGTPGTWISLSSPSSSSSLVTLASPVRLYDSRSGFLPSTGPKSPITTGSTVPLDVTNNSSGVPNTARAVLGNVTVTNSGNGFLTVYNAALSSAPATSSINLVPGVTLANNFTSACNPNHNIKVTCGGPGPSDFIIDIFGYYP